MITYGDLKGFLQINKEIKGDSLFVIIEGNELRFIKDISFLNLKGYYKWILPNGEALPRKQGYAIGLIDGWNTKTTFTDGSCNNKLTFDDLTNNTNTVITSDNRVKSLKELMTKLHNNVKENGGSDDSIIVSWRGSIVDKIESIQNITIYTQDNYGHKVVFSPKKPMLALISNDKLKQELYEEKSKLKYVVTREGKDSLDKALKDFMEFTHSKPVNKSEEEAWNEYLQKEFPKVFLLKSGIVGRGGEESNLCLIDRDGRDFKIIDEVKNCFYHGDFSKDSIDFLKKYNTKKHKIEVGCNSVDDIELTEWLNFFNETLELKFKKESSEEFERFSEEMSEKIKKFTDNFLSKWF